MSTAWPRKSIRGHLDDLREQYGPDECWPWGSKPTAKGYARTTNGVANKGVMVHRAVVEMLHGPIPEGYTVDHLCRNRMCANPAHLEAVPHAVNVRRGQSPAVLGRDRTHCKAGHEMTPENLTQCLLPYRVCRQCGRDKERAYRIRKRDERRVARAKSA